MLPHLPSRAYGTHRRQRVASCLQDQQPALQTPTELPLSFGCCLALAGQAGWLLTRWTQSRINVQERAMTMRSNLGDGSWMSVVGPGVQRNARCGFWCSMQSRGLMFVEALGVFLVGREGFRYNHWGTGKERTTWMWVDERGKTTVMHQWRKMKSQIDELPSFFGN